MWLASSSSRVLLRPSPAPAAVLPLLRRGVRRQCDMQYGNHRGTLRGPMWMLDAVAQPLNRLPGAHGKGSTTGQRHTSPAPPPARPYVCAAWRARPMNHGSFLRRRPIAFRRCTGQTRFHGQTTHGPKGHFGLLNAIRRGSMVARSFPLPRVSGERFLRFGRCGLQHSGHYV